MPNRKSMETGIFFIWMPQENVQLNIFSKLLWWYYQPFQFIIPTSIDFIRLIDQLRYLMSVVKVFLSKDDFKQNFSWPKLLSNPMYWYQSFNHQRRMLLTLNNNLYSHVDFSWEHIMTQEKKVVEVDLVGQEFFML